MSNYAEETNLDDKRKVGLLYNEQQNKYAILCESSGVTPEAAAKFMSYTTYEDGVLKTKFVLSQAAMDAIVEMYMRKDLEDDGVDISNIETVQYTVVYKEKGE